MGNDRSLLAFNSSLMTDSQPTIEVEVHSSLREFLRSLPERSWPHHLTMGRLVARALRLGRNALIQTGAWEDGSYRLSYLMPLLLWQNPSILVVSEAIAQRLLQVEIPRLQEWSDIRKEVRWDDREIAEPSALHSVLSVRWPEDFDGLLLVSPDVWLADKLSGGDRFPAGIPTIFDGADDLEQWTIEQLTVGILSHHWHELLLAYPDRAEAIRNARVQLTKAIFQHPANPYNCHLLDALELEILHELMRLLCEETPDGETCFPPAWRAFYQRVRAENSLTRAELDRESGQVSLYTSPADIAEVLRPIWQQQPIVLLGGALDLDSKAAIYRQRVGLDDLTCLKFAPDRQHEFIQLYLPDSLVLPNTPQFQPMLIRELHELIRVSSAEANAWDGETSEMRANFTAILIGDTPLRAIVGSILAAEFGSRVRVEQTELPDNGILVAGWEFWREHQAQLPPPKLLAIATLPLPSLENPLVAGRVAYYKQQRQDWFRLYLLPTALSELQRAIAPVRSCQGAIALFDSRAIHRSYGRQFLSALEPMARINYIDASLFAP
jgi:ATP-dependent DNA helicase DinG